MKLEVLGPGCPKCHAMAESVKAAADKLGLEYEFEHVTDITKIVSYGVMMTPALVIDGQVKCSGKAKKEAELTAMLTEALANKGDA